eukprot:TRINITY_DN24682_c0_g1_i1.p1 TRINITY_DN24682_c0_g1~~TRINITY_DN24682_c0_g1_i1.p1  ORF type:complete len:696 (-),score=119.41 TRINITY_DN24682_c0_g1_i1:91-2157(-)
MALPSPLQPRLTLRLPPCCHTLPPATPSAPREARSHSGILLPLAVTALPARYLCRGRRFFECFGPRSTRPCTTRGAAGREPVLDYSPAEVESQALQQPLAVALRTVEVVARIGQYYAALKLDDLLGKSNDETVKMRSRQLREVLLALGPCYIKLGQALANRPDIVRDDYMAELEELQDNVPPFPTDEAMRIIRQEIGQDPRQVFSELSSEPVAAASLGQVYRGKLRSTGEEVAVKVQRPNLLSALVVDMFIFRKLAYLLNGWAQANLGCNATLVVDEFGSKLWEEADYLKEAQNARSFAHNFKGDKFVKIPKVFSQYVGRRVITMEWIDGVKSTDLQGLRYANVDVDEFIRNGVQAALRQLLEFGLFHGDPHAGNIFAMRDGRIAYVDFGNVAYISEKQRDVLVRAITHVSNSDYEGIANDFVRLGFLRPGTDVSQIVPAMEVIWSDSMGKSIRDFNFRTVTASFSKLVYQFPIRIPERFSLVIRALLMQEGICLCLNPEFSIIEVALPYASQRLLSDPNPSMRRELLNIVFRDDEVTGRPVLQWDRLRNLVELAKQARDGSSIQFDQVIVDFFRGLRRDLSLGEAPDLEISQVVRGGLEALVAGDRLRVQEVLQVLELVSPDLTPALAREVADALIRDSVEDVLRAQGVELDADDLRDPRQLGKILQALSQPKELLKLLRLPLPRPL